MEYEQRKKFIYDVLKRYQNLSYSDLWRQIKNEFSNETFAKDTFDKTLKDLVNDKVIIREEDPNSKQRVLYYVSWNFDKNKEELVTNYTSRLHHYNMRLDVMEPNFDTMDIYDKARDFVLFNVLLKVTELSMEKLLDIYPNEKRITSSIYELKKIMNRLNKFKLKISKKEKNEFEQLVLKNLMSYEVKEMTNIHSLYV